MPTFPYHQQLHLTNFTTFADAEFEFSPGVNAIIGENSSGKTHLLKAMYAYQRSPSRDVPNIHTTLLRLFQTDDITKVMRSPVKRNSVTDR
jgi:predicted ATP-dependent endonuclease of OLD family